MDSAEILRQALHAARNGRELTARDLFLDVVRLDPDNETAWIWLSGLLDPLEDRLAACERVLSINPGNGKMRTYYEKLLRERIGERQEKAPGREAKIDQVRSLVEAGKRDAAMLLVQKILREEDDNKEAWRFFGELSKDINDKIRAYQTLVQLDPEDRAAQAAFRRYRKYLHSPLELAALYEEQGKLDKALELYEALAAEAGDSPEFDRLYKKIVQLEDAQIENVRYVKPAFTILRLSLGLPLLYLLEIFIQEGLNPIRHPAPGLWLGIPLVLLGSFLLTVASVRVRHVIWRRWFGDRGGRGSSLMRAFVAFVGLILILAPHLFLAWDSYLRLQMFQVPAIPWIE
jgi:tetratricopeptide (TPR) repeat protein